MGVQQVVIYDNLLLIYTVVRNIVSNWIQSLRETRAEVCGQPRRKDAAGRHSQTLRLMGDSSQPERLTADRKTVHLTAKPYHDNRAGHGIHHALYRT